MSTLILSVWNDCTNDVSVLETEPSLRTTTELHGDDAAGIDFSTESGPSANGFRHKVVAVRQVLISGFRDAAPAERIV